jgi:hypothetical protein
MEWNRTYKHFGEVPEDTSHSFTFVYNGDKEYLKHNAECQCVVSKWEGNKLTATIKADKITELAKNKYKRFYSEIKKNIFVHFKDGTAHRLELHLTSIAKEWL